MNIIVTGAGKGIGFSIVKKLIENKNNTVYGISRNIEKLEKLKEKKSGKLIPVVFDLNSLKELRKPLNFPEKGVWIDILINNAGYLINKPFEEFSYEEIEQIFYTNIISQAILIKTLLPCFNHEGAHIVNIGSMGGFQGSVKFSGLSLYSASKGALATLTECLANEYKHTKLKFNCLALSAVQTEMFDKAFPGYKATILPEEMANFIIDFAFNASKFINGKIIPVSITNP